MGEICAAFIYLIGTFLLLMVLICTLLLKKILGTIQKSNNEEAKNKTNNELVAAISTALSVDMGTHPANMRIQSFRQVKSGGREMRKYNVRVNGTSYEVEIEEVGIAPVRSPYSRPPVPRPASANVPVIAEPTALLEDAPDTTLETAGTAPVPASVTGGMTVSAPLPGTVISVCVSIGQTVERNQPLVIVEAMKMQNEIVAAKAGTVISINVQKGVTVNAGDTLIVLA